MKKRILVTVIALFILSAAIVHAQVYGTSTSITRQVYLPKEGNLHLERQENLTLLSMQRLDAREQKINEFQPQVSNLRVSI